MGPVALLAGLVLVCCVVLAVYLLRAKATKVEARQEPVAAVRQGGAAGRATRLRRRQQAAAPQAEAGEDDEDELEEEAATSKTRAGRLAAKKAQKRAAKLEAREARAAAGAGAGSDDDGDEGGPAPPTVKLSAYDQERQRKDAAAEAADRAQEEEIERAQAERAQREAAEFAHWKGAISVEGAGEAAQSQQQEAQLREDLAAHIKACKMVQLEELSAEFKTRTKEIIDHIHALEASGQLTGVMDDRGKYVYLSEAELAAVADLIRSKGRINISQLATEASKLLDLETKGGGMSSSAMEMSLDQLVDA